MQRRKGIAVSAVLSSLLLSGASSPSGCNSSNQQIGPSSGEVYGAAAGIAAGVAVAVIVVVEVHKSHHTVKGCVFAGPEGLTLHSDGDQKVYALTGVTTSVKPGDIVKLHGDKDKKQKDAAGDEDFMIQKISRDYGPCKAEPAAPAAGSAL